MNPKNLPRIKSRRLERRLSLSLAGMRAGVNILAGRATDWWLAPAEQRQRRSATLSRQAEVFADELGRLKGSYVKIGQMLALFGEHLLPRELTSALHKLEHQTAAVDWLAMSSHIEQELGDRYAQLRIDTQPIGAASLAQVHRATVVSSGEGLCLKIQYPGIKDSIHSDFDDVVSLLKLANWLPAGRDMEDWLSEIRAQICLEVNYSHEARMTQAMAKLVARDQRYQVPTIATAFCSDQILAMDYLPGLAVTDPAIQKLPLPRRNQLGRAMLDLLLSEIFQWGLMQTDPNFGNYRIHSAADADRLVLLDFGALRKLEPKFLANLQWIIAAALRDDLAGVISASEALGCIKTSHPDAVKQSFGQFCLLLLEPLRQHDEQVPAYALTSTGLYRWRESRLIKRAGKFAAQSAFSAQFTLPPREFVLITRKLVGVFTFIATLGAEFNGYDLLQAHVRKWEQTKGRRTGRAQSTN